MGQSMPRRACIRLGRFEWLPVTLCALLALPDAAQSQRSQATMAGRVIEEGSERPISDATILLKESGRGTRSDEHGRFLLTVPLGRHTLVISHLAYTTVENTLELRESGGTYDVVIRMATDVIPLDPLTATVRDEHGAFTDVRDRIERMRRLGVGESFDREEIDASGAHRLSHLVARLPGVRVQPLRNRAGVGELRLNQRSNCAPSFYMDGVQVPMDGGSIDDAIAISDIEYVEIYRRLSELPAEFADDRALYCGAIAVWMRRGTEAGEAWGWRRMIAAGAFAALGFLVFGHGF